MHRIIQQLDPAQLQQVLMRYSQHRKSDLPALASDGKRIRGANRNGARHYETATLVEHDSGLPWSSVTTRCEGQQIEAVRQLFETVDITGRVITLDALHNTFETVGLILARQADYLLTLKDNTQRQLDHHRSLNWRGPKVRRFPEPVSKAHGRIERRHIEVLEVDDGRRFDFRQVRQTFRITREREQLGDPDSASAEIASGITSVDAGRADAQQLLAWNGGHWSVENKNHYIRDKTFGEDGCMTRTGHGPSNNALCGNIALALIFHHGQFDSVPEAQRYYSLNREDAIKAVCASL